MEINATRQRNTAQKGVHYMPTMKLRDNKRIGYSYDSSGATQAKGTLYPYNMNNNTEIGAVSSMYATEHTTTEDYDYDYESYTNNEVKYKTAEEYFQYYRKFKGLTLGFVQQALTVATSTLFGTSGRLMVQKMYAVTSTTFTIVYTQTSTAGVYAVVGTVNASTGAITFGTSVSLSGVSALTTLGNVDFIEISTAKYAVVFQQTATTMRNIVFTVSGTTVTSGTAVDLTITSVTLGSVQVRMSKVDTDKYMTIYSNASAQGFIWASTVSGTVVTNGTVQTIWAGGANRQYANIALNSTTSGLLYCSNASNNAFVQAFTLSGTVFTLGTELQIGSNGADIGSYGTALLTMRALPSGQYYILNSGSSPHEYYISVSGTAPALSAYRTLSLTPASNHSYEWYIDANEWIIKKQISSVDYLMCMKYDTTTQKVNVTDRELLEQPVLVSANLACVGKVGTQFVMLASASSDSTNIYSYTAQEGSAELYFEAEGSAFTTVTCVKYGWAFSKQLFTKTISRMIAYLSIKNKTGNTVLIKTRDWLFEVQ